MLNNTVKQDITSIREEMNRIEEEALNKQPDFRARFLSSSSEGRDGTMAVISNLNVYRRWRALSITLEQMLHHL